MGEIQQDSDATRCWRTQSKNVATWRGFMRLIHQQRVKPAGKKYDDDAAASYDMYRPVYVSLAVAWGILREI